MRHSGGSVIVCFVLVCTTKSEILTSPALFLSEGNGESNNKKRL